MNCRRVSWVEVRLRENGSTTQDLERTETSPCTPESLLGVCKAGPSGIFAGLLKAKALERCRIRASVGVGCTGWSLRRRLDDRSARLGLSFRQVADHVVDLPQSLLSQPGARPCRPLVDISVSGCADDSSPLRDVDVDALDRAAGTCCGAISALTLMGRRRWRSTARFCGVPGLMRTRSSRCSLPWSRRWE